MKLKQLFQLIWEHKEWLFSGIGITIITLFMSMFFPSDKRDNILDEYKDSNDIKIHGNNNGNIYENSIINNYNTVNNNDEINNNEKSIIMSESKYLEYLNSVTDKDIVYHYYNDFDGDGICEMFALVGEVRDYSIAIIENNITGKIWYVNQNGAIEVESDDIEYWAYPYVFSVDGNAFIAFEKAFGTGTLTYIWGVKNGIPYQPNISKKGNGLKINEYNEIEVTLSTYDMVQEKKLKYPTGHTWKKYYFYFDGKTFREYGGIKISVNDILNIPNGEMIIKEINNKTCAIDSIFYRSNGIININISKESEQEINYYTITIRYDGNKWSFVKSEFGDNYGRGIYLKEMIPAVATYPDKYPY